MLVVAQISDLHIDGSERAAERAVRVMRFLEALTTPIDAILVTGDIADHGLPAEYEQVRKILDTANPVFPCPGNHDVRAAYREVLLGDEPGDDPINRVHTAGGATFVMCDSSIPGQNDGYLADETLAWLDDVLHATAGGPTFVCFHHPPVQLGNPTIDAIRQFGSDRLAAVLDRHPQVIAVLCGHAHMAAATTFAGRPLLVAPGVTSTVRLLPWEPGHYVDLQSPPAIAFHILDDDNRLTTHYRVVI